jgi:hypothetical protein
MAIQLLTQARDAKTEGSLEGSRSIFVVIFLAFLVMAIAYLLCGQNWRTQLPGAEGTSSVFNGVKTAAYTVMSELF